MIPERVAECVVAGLPPDVRRPQRSQSDDGEIGLSWFRGKDRFEAMIEEANLVWVTRIAGEFASGGEIALDESLESLAVFFEALVYFYAPACVRRTDGV